MSRLYLRISVHIPRPTDVVLLLVDGEIEVLHVLLEPEELSACDETFVQQDLPDRREYTAHTSTNADDLDRPVVIDGEVAEVKVGGRLGVDTGLGDKAPFRVVKELSEDVRRHWCLMIGVQETR